MKNNTKIRQLMITFWTLVLFVYRQDVTEQERIERIGDREYQLVDSKAHKSTLIVT